MTHATRNHLVPVMLLALLVVFQQSGVAQTDDRPGVGVLPIRNGGSFGDEPQDYERLQVGLQELLITELVRNSNLRVVERGQLRELLREQDIPADRVDAATAARIGKVVGARYMVLGGFVDWQGTFRIDARIVDTETTEVLDAVRVEDDREKLLHMVVELAAAIVDKADLPPLESQPREERPASQADYRAVKLYSYAVELRDLGRPDDARRMLERIVEEFPEFVQARQALNSGL